MTAEIIMFVPRSNQKSDRAFWIGQTEAEQREAILTLDSTKGWTFDPTTNLWSANEPIPYQAPTDDPA